MPGRTPDERQPGVVFSRPAAERIAAAVRSVERAPGSQSATHWPYQGDEPDVIKICRTRSEWRFGTTARLDEYDDFSTLFPPKPDLIDAYNRVITLPPDHWVIVGRIVTDWPSWYLLSFSMQELQGYDVAKDQFLGHSREGAPVLKWIDKPDLLDYPGFDSNYDQNLQHTAGGEISWAVKPTLEDVPGYDQWVDQIIEHGIMGKAFWGPKPLIPPAP